VKNERGSLTFYGLGYRPISEFNIGNAVIFWRNIFDHQKTARFSRCENERRSIYALYLDSFISQQSTVIVFLFNCGDISFVVYHQLFYVQYQDFI